MLEKNSRKIKNRKSREFWTCARPVTQVVPNKRAYDRKRVKDSMAKGKEDTIPHLYKA